MIRRQVVIVVDGGKRVDGSLRKADELYYGLSFCREEGVRETAAALNPSENHQVI